MSDQPIQDESESLTAPGKLLRDRRESLGFTQAEVASKMRLSQQSIKDIEADDYSYFSAPIYVRGYLRSYANILGMTADHLLFAFDEMGFVDQLNQSPRPSYISSSVSRSVRLQRSKNRAARWMSLVFFGLLITLVAMWWHGQSEHKYASLSTKIMNTIEKPAATASQHEAVDTHLATPQNHALEPVEKAPGMTTSSYQQANNKKHKIEQLPQPK